MSSTPQSGGGPSEQGAFIIVPPNLSPYANFDTLERLELFLRAQLPSCSIEVARITQPRVATFTVVAVDSGDQDYERSVATIKAAIARFDPATTADTH